MATISDLYTHLNTLTKKWFYTKSEIKNIALTGKATDLTDATAHSNIGSSANSTQANINTKIDAALGTKANTNNLSTVATTGNYSDLSGIPSSFPPSSHNHTGAEVKDSTAHSNIGSSANDTQATINTKIDTALGTKANTSSLKTVATTGKYSDLTGIPSTFTPSSHTHSTSELTDSTAYNRLGTSAGATQATINNAINTKIGALLDVDLITVVTSLGTASASTMNKLYLVAESSSKTNDAYEIYVTVRTGSSGNYSYAWEKVDTARIDLSGYSTTSHTHGNITSDGKVGSTANKPLITTTNGAVTTGSFEATATNIKMNGTQSVGSLNTFARGDHVHPTDTSRAASSHAHGNITNDGKVGTAANKPLITTTNGAVTTGSFGSSTSTSATEFVACNDSRLSNARTPTSHNQAVTTITNDQAYNNIKAGESTTLTLTTQKLINDAINTKLASKVDTVSGKGLSTNDFNATYKGYVDNLVSSTATTKNAHVHGNITSDGKVGSASGKIITTGTNGVLQASNSITKSLISDFPTTMTPSSHTHGTGDVSDSSAYTNIGSNANATQKTINDKINTALGNKANSSNVYSKSETYTQSEITTLISNAVAGLQLFEVVESLPTTNIKNNRLYLIVNGETIANNSYDIYLRVNDSWESLDALEFDISNFYNKTEVDTLLNGKVDTSDSRLTDTRTPKSHTHGNITNNGAVGSTANKPLITTTNGVVTTGSFGTSANTFCQGNDSRLSDARTPTSHSHGSLANGGTLNSDITSVNKIAVTDSSNNLKTISQLPYSKISGTPTIPTKVSDLTNDSGFLTQHQSLTNYVTTTDSRLSDARTPTSHTHGNLQNDGIVKISGTAQKTKNLVTDANGYITAEAKPTIPTKTSQLTNDSGFLTSHQDISGKIDTAGTGLSKNGTTLNHSNSITAVTTAAFKKIKYDAQGHITGTSDVSKLDITGLGIPSSDTTYSAEKGITLSSGKFGHSNTAITAQTTSALKKIKYDSYGHITGTDNVSANDLPSHGHTLDDVQLYDPITGNPVFGYDGTGYLYALNDTLYINTNDDNIPYLSSSDSPIASLADIPTNNNQLTNGAGYITSSAISGKIDTAGTGLSKSGTTLNHSNSITAVTTAAFKKIKYDAQGHITGTADVSASDLPSHTHNYLSSHQSIGTTSKNTTNGSELAQVTADSVNKGSIYHPKVNTSALTGVPTANQTPTFGGTFSVSQPSVNTDGHVTALTSRTITIPSLPTASTSAAGIIQIGVGETNAAAGNHTHSGYASTSDIPTATSDLTNDGEDGTNAFISEGDSRLTNARTPTSHSHGNIENGGTITATTTTATNKIATIGASDNKIYSFTMTYTNGVLNIGG